MTKFSGFCILILAFIGSNYALPKKAQGGPAQNTKGTCSYNLDARTGSKPPIILKDGDFFYPTSEDADGNRYLVVGSGDLIQFYCHKELIDGQSSNILDATCNSKGVLEAENGADLQSLSCDRSIEPAITRKASACSPEGADGRPDPSDMYLVNIGWNMPDGSFKNQIELCVDEKYYVTMWTSHDVVGESIDVRDKTSGRPSFRRDVTTDPAGMFSEFPSQSAIEESYTKASQVDQMFALLGHNEYNGQPIIETDSSSNFYFARGHLAPDAAFVTDPEQDATYYFVNVAPQFQTFNNGNWKVLEGAVRDLGASVKRTLEVYTGTFGTLQYPNVADVMTDIFIYTEDGNEWISAPQYYWKVINDPGINQAIAFIGVNDPHNLVPPPQMCESHCDGLSWVDWDINSLDSGYMYCCKVEELRDSIPYLPDLRVNGQWPDLMVDQKAPEPVVPIAEDSCVYDLELRTGKHDPFTIQNGEFLYPEREIEVDGDKHRILEIKNGEELRFHCHGATERYTSVLTLNNEDDLTVTCASGTFKDLSGAEVDVASLSCSDKMEPDMIMETNVACATESLNGRSVSPDNLLLTKVGWTIDETFKEQYQMCQDLRSYSTLWTSHTIIGKSIELRDKTAGRPSFRTDVRGEKRFFTGFSSSTAMAESYTKASQVEQMNKLYGADATLKDGQSIIENTLSSNFYFARGHLSPDAAFITDTEQDATYYYFNVAPQFQTFNNGNWKVAEDAVRDLAWAKKKNLNVYTGTYGILFYYNDGKRVSFYLDTEDGNKFIAAPKYYWKVVHDPELNEAVALVGYNDPHDDSLPSKMCTSVCDQISWVDWDINNNDSGWMYCCKVEDLKKVIDYVPDLPGATLLTA